MFISDDMQHIYKEIEKSNNDYINVAAMSQKGRSLHTFVVPTEKASCAYVSNPNHVMYMSEKAITPNDIVTPFFIKKEDPAWPYNSPEWNLKQGMVYICRHIEHFLTYATNKAIYNRWVGVFKEKHPLWTIWDVTKMSHAQGAMHSIEGKDYIVVTDLEILVTGKQQEIITFEWNPGPINPESVLTKKLLDIFDAVENGTYKDLDLDSFFTELRMKDKGELFTFDDNDLRKLKRYFSALAKIFELHGGN